LNYFPIALRLKDKRVIVVGAGRVAKRKIKILLDSGAKIIVIAPWAELGIQRLAKNKVLNWQKRSVRRLDLKLATLVIAATDNRVINEQVSHWARQEGIKVNVVDKPAICDFITPALIRFKKALLAIYTDGRDPVLSRDLKNYLKENWNDFLSYRDRL